jgi:carboxyl-terminal processing protease
VVSPIEDTPADRIGIQAGDMIIKIDNEPTRDMSLIDAVKKLRGPVNTDVTITVLRKDLRTPKDFTITRAIIMIKSVWSRLMEDNIGYIRLRNFSKTTSNEVRSALDKLSSQKKKKLKGLVLDLRNNPGGLLNQAVEVADIFIKKGQLIVYTEGRTPDQNMKFKSRKNGKNVDLPLVILVNGGSASASEIVAGALKDLKRCLVMGTKTFGKGSVQTIIPLSNGAALRLTTAQYFTPSGKVIHKKGIMPDIVLENPKISLAEEEKNDEKDPSVHKFDQKEVSGQDQKTKQKKSDNINPKEARFLKVYKKDLQLQRAIELLRGVDIFQKILQKKAS